MVANFGFNFIGMRRISLFLTLLVVLFVMYSCKKNDSNNTVDAKYQYFPNDTGHYVIYDVDSIKFDPFYDSTDSRHVDSVHFQLMEITQSIFNDNAGRPTMRIERYTRPDSNATWTILNVWSATRTATTAEKFEDNLRFIKMIFPPSTTTTWKGNSYIDLTGVTDLSWMADWDYQITALDVPYASNGQSYDSTLTVLQHDEENLIEKRFGKEIYAKNVGMVYKQMLHLKKNVSSSFPSGSSDGFICTMRAWKHGRQ